MDASKINYAIEPKIYCDQVGGGFNKEIFLTGMFSGEQLDVYAFTPAHAKRLALWLSSQVQAYEKQFGEIDANLPKPIQSPIQPGDLKDGASGKKK